MSTSASEIWQSPEQAQIYLDTVRGGIPLETEQLKCMVHFLRGIERPVRRVLDIGCGDGVLAGRILSEWPRAEAVLVDLSPRMLNAARIELADYVDRVHLVEADYGTPAWLRQVKGPFDVIVSGFSIHHQPNQRKQAVYNEVYELLEPGGAFLNLEHVASASEWGAQRFEDLMIDSLHTYAGTQDPAASRESTLRQYKQRSGGSVNILERVEAQCEWLRLIGFEDVDIYFKLFELALFGGRKPVAA